MHRLETIYRDRLTGEYCREKLFAGRGLVFLYGDGWLSRSLGRGCGYLASRSSLFSAMMGRRYRSTRSRRAIEPFIAAFDVDMSESVQPVEAFESFNAFFIRRLKAEARPVAAGANVAVMPADGRYLFYPDIASGSDAWMIKEQKLDLDELVGDVALANEYRGGTLVIARLCPFDYHRFHFPCECRPTEARLINGYLASVHPLALKQNLRVLTTNKRFVTSLETEAFGKVLYIEIGALGVGSVVQTYHPGEWQPKGSEKGYFEFGASCLVLLFKRGTISLDADLLAGEPGVEVRCLMGQSLGKSCYP